MLIGNPGDKVVVEGFDAWSFTNECNAVLMQNSNYKLSSSHVDAYRYKAIFYLEDSNWQP